MILNEREMRHAHLVNAVKQIMTAARTAPKGKGMDLIEIAAVEGEDIKVLSAKTQELGKKMNLGFMLRDAENILAAEAIILIGTQAQTHGLNCEHCGYATCSAKPEWIPCVLNSVDVGIAIGSACATIADLRLDSRVMFSAGLAAQKLNWLKGCQSVFAIPVSASSKNPFFDRKPKE
jgi:uncharacterized ferredoxin-like protein